MTRFSFKGPPFEEGALPAIYYFALSAEDSLNLDPYNQPVTLLSDAKVRIFSKTLPCHGPNLDKKEAMTYWADELSHNRNIIADCINETHSEITELIDQGIIDPERIACMGLSRGAFIATHLAARDPRIHTVLGFAPLVSFHALKEFHHLHSQPLVHALSLNSLTETLIHKKIRFYIGNRDERVGTDHCFSFIHHLADIAWKNGVRSPTAELMISPSIGYKGHGTAPDTFQDGVNWMTKTLNLI